MFNVPVQKGKCMQLTLQVMSTAIAIASAGFVCKEVLFLESWLSQSQVADFAVVNTFNLFLLFPDAQELFATVLAVKKSKEKV